MFRQFQKLQRATGNFFGILLLLAVILLASTVYLGKVVYDLKKPALSAEAEVRRLVEEVGKAMILPQEELPTVAKVADVSQLANQPFFQNARTGDEILIYEQARKAILWRPSVRRIVEVSSLLASPAAADLSSESEN